MKIPFNNPVPVGKKKKISRSPYKAVTFLVMALSQKKHMLFLRGVWAFQKLC